MWNERRQRAMRPGAILSRLLVVLALALFGVPQIHSDRSAAHAGPITESRVDHSDGLLIMQRNLLRTQQTGDDYPDPADRVTSVPALPAPPAAQATIPRSEDSLRAGVRLLPPIRGPPAV